MSTTLALPPRWASSSLQLSGQAYVDCGKPAILNNITAFTVEAWVNTTSLTAYQSIVSNTNVIATIFNGQFQLYLYNGTVGIVAGIGASYTGISSTQSITANAWHHLAATFSNGTLSLYIDGTLAAQSTNQGNLTTTGSNLFIGGALEKGTPSDFFQGQIGRVMIWNIARSAEDILDDSVQLSIYNAIETPHLVFYTDFSVMPAVDSSGNNAQLAFKNNAQYFYNVPAAVLGTNGYVNCGSYADYSIPGNKPYTIEGWFFPKAATSGTLLSYGTKGGWEYQVLYQNNQVVGKRNSDSLQVVSQTAVVPNSYYHFALTYDGTTRVLSLYINGNLQSVGYFNSPVTAVPNGTVLLGAQFDNNGNPTAFFNGAIQNIRIWNICLEQAEISQWLYNDVVDDDRLIANYDFTVTPPVDNTDQATLTLSNGAVTTLQQTSIDPTSFIAQLGIPQSINAVYLSQYTEKTPAPPPNITFAPQPDVFSHAHREESWQHLIGHLNLQDDENARNSARQSFEAVYENARQMTADNPLLLKTFTRTDENGLTRIVYHGIKGNVLVYESPVGTDSDCVIWWIAFVYLMTVGAFQAFGILPPTGDIAKRVYNLIAENVPAMSKLKLLAGGVITVTDGIGFLKILYDQGLMWTLTKLVFVSAGWYTLYWILKKVILIVTGYESVDGLARFIVWAGQMTTASLTYKGSCGS